MTQVQTVLVPREFTPKRGIKDLHITYADKTLPFKSHHQKILILEILEGTETKSMFLKDMIEKVEKDETLKLRLQSKQSVFNCITYHLKDFAKLGILKMTEGKSPVVTEQKMEEIQNYHRISDSVE